ncbi:MAG: DNA repair protein RecN [Anaerolineales bacterium]|jgi:DNA repair protein RecN (Recombination protein N)
MLSELDIRNFAIIDELHLRFRPGLIVFTGETGAGKSIIVDAIELLLGGRGDPALIRAEEETATVEGEFRIPEAVRDELRAILEREALWDQEDFLILGREIRRQGKNVARVNGRVTSLGLLRDIGQYLVDVHGQSEHLSLLRVREHLYLLDRFAGTEALRADFAAAVETLREVRVELERLRQGERDAARRSDMLTFQLNEITAAKLQPGEEEPLLEERIRLANAEQLAGWADQAIQGLDEGAEERAAATDLLGEAVQSLGALTRVDPSQSNLRDSAQALLDELSDLVHGLRRYRESIEFNPRRLEQVEERLELLRLLKRKYGETLAGILQYAQSAQGELEAISHSDERMAELAAREETLLRDLGQKGEALSRRRKQAAETLARAVEVELSDLRMSGARFQVEDLWEQNPEGVILGDQRLAFDATGIDRVEFLVAPNPGEGLKPLVKIASGGETSRLMLALKSVLARADRTSTLIFDEIDQGIGGRVGSIVGKKLWRLTPDHQVLCVTHLPQLAGYGDQHYRVEKVAQGERTVTRAHLLSPGERVHELAAMLGTLSEKTRESAEEILEMVQADKAAGD